MSVLTFFSVCVNSKDNKFEDMGAALLSESLKSNTTLAVLDLSGEKNKSTMLSILEQTGFFSPFFS